MSDELPELHDLDPEVFRREVRSFEFWFGAVRDYLDGLSYGHRPETPEAARTDPERERLVTILCNYCVGETAALEGAGGLIQIAPNTPSKVFLSTQTVDEGRHLEVIVHRLLELGVANPEAEVAVRASPSILEFRRRLLELVTSRDWEAALFAQNVILESMEFSVFRAHAARTDPRTREMLEGIIKDERRHIGFGENELGRVLRDLPSSRRRLTEIRDELDDLVFRCFEETMGEVGAGRSDRTQLGRQYVETVGRLGFA